MDHGTVLGDANKKPVPKNSPVMHCQRRYYQASCAIPKWLICTNKPVNSHVQSGQFVTKLNPYSWWRECLVKTNCKIVKWNVFLFSSQDCPRAVHELMLQCWNENRSERPSFERAALLISNWIRTPKSMQDELKCLTFLDEWQQSVKMGSVSYC